MKIQTILITILFVFCNACFAFAQSPKLNKADLKTVTITMKQEASKGWGGGINNPYTVTLDEGGRVTFDGWDEGKAISKYEPPVKVTRKFRISKNQFKQLVNEFYRIDFFSLSSSYCCRNNEDGTLTTIADGGLATVITSITISEKTKTVTNYFFAPEKLIELQREIYRTANIARFVKFPPYWLSKFPNEQFPPHSERNLNAETQPPSTKAEYRKIQRNSPKGRREKHIDLDKRWGFIKPCLTTKTEIEKLLGKPIVTDGQNFDLYTYSLKDEKIRVYYSSARTNKEICGGNLSNDVVILFPLFQ